VARAQEYSAAGRRWVVDIDPRLREGGLMEKFFDRVNQTG
jgi:hypothetical protein